MKYRKVNALDYFDDDNNGLIYGLESNEDFPEYVEWFKTEKGREETINKYKLRVVK